MQAIRARNFVESRIEIFRMGNSFGLRRSEVTSVTCNQPLLTGIGAARTTSGGAIAVGSVLSRRKCGVKTGKNLVVS
jgi:hypothetical protein